MGKNPPGEQELLFLFLKALKVYSASETTNLISSAEMLKRERGRKGKKSQWRKAGKGRGGEKRKEKMEVLPQSAFLALLLVR